MKPFGSPDALPALFSVSQSREDGSSRDLQGYSREFQEMLDSLVEEDSLFEETLKNTMEKKRRLSVDQVKALEKSFETGNKLEPEKKAKIAEELGLQPRQVAIWFQNRRARWKTKQLEKDYVVLKADYDALKLDYSNLQQERQVLTSKVKELRAKLRKETRGKEQCRIQTEPIREEHEEEGEEEEKFQKPIMSPSSSSSRPHLHGSSSSSSSRSWLESYRISNFPVTETQTVKSEEPCSMFTAEEPCNFFSVDHAPTLQWYFNGQ